MYAIECHGLSKTYGAAPAVDGLSLCVERGEVVGFVGPNGAGKTTTMRMLVGLTRPTSGSATVLGAPLPAPAHVLARVGALIEDPAFYPWMTARRWLRVLSDSGAAAVPPARIDEVLDSVGLASAGGERIKTFSQGMRQRLAIAGAIMHEPELLIIDEPTNGLDPAGISWLRVLLLKLGEAGTAVLFSSHQLGEVERVCNRVAIINEGRLVESSLRLGEGTRQSVMVTVRGEDHEAALEALAGFAVSVVGPGTLAVNDAEPRDVSKALAVRRVYPETIVREDAALERRFLELTGV